MRFAVGLGMLPGKTVRGQFAAAKELGCDAVEVAGRDFDDTMPEIAAAARKTGVPVCTICAGYRGSPLAAEPAEREQALADIEALLAWAGRLGAVGLIVVPAFGRLRLPDLSPYRSAWDLQRELLLAILPRLAEAARKADALLLLEALNRYETAFLNRQEQVAEAIAAADRPDGVKLMADFFHMNIEEADPPAALRAVAGHLAHVHLADNTRKQPGTGMLDFRAHFAALKAIGFDGYGALECAVDGADRMQALAETLAFLRTAYEQA